MPVHVHARLRWLALPGILAAASALAAGSYGFRESEYSVSLKLGDVSPPAEVESALNQWQSTGVRLERGASYLVYADGSWQLAPTCAPTGPDGTGLYGITCWDVGGKTVEGVTHAALIGRIGHDGPPFAVRSSKELTADRSGYLYLMVNDHPAWFGDNSGSVTARVRMLGAAPARGGETTEITIRQETREGASSVTIKRGGGGGGGGGGASGGSYRN